MMPALQKSGPGLRQQPQARAPHPSLSIGANVGDAKHTTAIAEIKAIPAELRELKQWTVWKYGAKQNASGKFPKVPYTTEEPHATDRTNGCGEGYQDVIAAYQARPDFFSGIGFVLKQGIVVVDFDNCIIDGMILARVQYWIERCNSFTEVSVSGKGIHIWLRGTIPTNIRDTATDTELYQNKRFIAMTGERVKNTPNTIRDAQDALDALYAEVRPAPKECGAHVIAALPRNEDGAIEIQGTKIVFNGEGEDATPYAILDAQAITLAHVHVAAWLDRDAIPRFLKPHSAGRRILLHALAGKECHNEARHSVVYSLVMHKYADVQIAALLWYYRDNLNSGNKSETNWAQDIARLIARARIAYPNVVPYRDSDVVTTSRASQMPESLRPTCIPTRSKTVQSTGQHSRARKDRPRKVDGPTGYLNWLTARVDPEHGSVMLSAKECATALGIHIRTIHRYEEYLRTDGRIERRAYANRQLGCIYILDVIQRDDNIPAFVPESIQATVVTGDLLVPLPGAVGGELNTMHDHSLCLPPPTEGTAPIHNGDHTNAQGSAMFADSQPILNGLSTDTAKQLPQSLAAFEANSAHQPALSRTKYPTEPTWLSRAKKGLTADGREDRFHFEVRTTVGPAAPDTLRSRTLARTQNVRLSHQLVRPELDTELVAIFDEHAPDHTSLEPTNYTGGGVDYTYLRRLYSIATASAKEGIARHCALWKYDLATALDQLANCKEGTQ